VYFRSLDLFNRDAPSRLRHNLRLSTADCCTATPMVYVTVGGNFIVAALVTQVFSIDNRVYGWMASLPAWCNALQVMLVPWLARWTTSRGLSLGGAIAHAAVWGLVAVALPWLPREHAGVAARYLFVGLVLASLAQSFASVGWTSWVQDWLPRRVRGTYFGARNRFASVVTVAFFLFVGWVTEHAENSILAYQLIFGLAALLRVFSCIWQAQMVTVSPESSNLVYLGWSGQLTRLAGEKSFIRFVLYGAVTAFVMNLSGPFYPVFAYERLDITVDQYALLVLLATVGSAIAWPWWGRFADRHGCRNVIILSLIFCTVTDLWWPFLRAGHALWPLYIVWVWSGGAQCGFLIGSLNWLLKLVPTQARVAGVSFNLASTSLMAALAPIVSGSLLQAARSAGDHATDWTFRGLLLSKPILQMLALLLLRGVAEPEGRPFQTLLGAMRTQRQVLATQFLPFLANFQPSRTGRPIRRKQSSREKN